MKIAIFTGVTSVRSKNIFTDISRYPTAKHEIKLHYFLNVLDTFLSIAPSIGNNGVLL